MLQNAKKKSQKLKMCNLKTSKCDKTKKFKMEKYSQTTIVTKLKYICVVGTT